MNSRWMVLAIAALALSAALWWVLPDEETAIPEVNGLEPASDGHPSSDASAKDDAPARTADSQPGPSDDDEQDPGATEGNGLILNSESPDWDAIADVDETREALIRAFEAGDVHAAYQLYEIAQLCILTLAIEDMGSGIDEEVDPDRRANMGELHQRAASMEARCQASSLADPRKLITENDRWLEKAADAGHAEAMYRTLFAGVRRMRPDDDDAREEQLAREQAIYERLRDNCHARSLHSTGMHLARGSAIVGTLDRQTDWGRDDHTSRHMDAFAHRYAAARLNDDGRPAEQARDSQHLLTAEEELQAREWADSLLASCP